MKRKTLFILLVLTAGAILVACQGEPEVVEVTRVVTETEVVEGETIEVTRVVEGETVVEEVEVTRVVETVVEPETEPVDRTGGWLDTIVIVEEPDSNSGVARLEAGDLEVYADDVGGEAALQAIESPAVETRTQYGLFDELYFNLATCTAFSTSYTSTWRPVRMRTF